MAQTTLEGFENGFEKMEANTLDHLKTVRSRIRKILEQHPSTKGNDLLLYFYYLKHYENDRVSIRIIGGFKNILKTTTPETVRRARQIIQERERKKELEDPNYKSVLLPTERTLKKRERREEILREGLKEL